MSFSLQMVELDGREGWFNPNNRGMRELRFAMSGAGLLEQPDYCSLRDAGKKAEIAAYEERCLRAPRDARADDPHKVPKFKFHTNQGEIPDTEPFYDWLLVPDECRLVAAALAKVTREEVAAAYEHKRAYLRGLGHEGERLAVRVGEPDDLEASMSFVREFAEFCRGAAEHGGFRLSA